MNLVTRKLKRWTHVMAGGSFALISLGLSLPAFSADPAFKCSEHSSTLEIFMCLDKVQQELDVSLDKTYRRFLGTLKKMETASFTNMPKGLLVEGLKSSQQAWIAYRASSCDLHENLAFGGSAAKTNRIACNVRMTKQRLNELDEQSTYWENR